jgi:hypothetical protein
VKYNKAALETAARAALDSNRDWHDKELAQAKAADEQAAQQWRERHAEAWLSACRSIARQLRKGGVVTANDLPKVSDGYRCNDIALHKPPREYAPWREPADLANAATRLAALDLAVVSARQLTELGIEANTLRRITPFLAPGSVVG